MTMGEIGCFLSHYAIWQEVKYYQIFSVGNINLSAKVELRIDWLGSA